MDRIKELCTRIAPCGSRVTCNPPVLDTDEDFILLVTPDQQIAFNRYVLENGWVLGGSDIPEESNILDPDKRFQSYTLGDKNLIVTASEVFYWRFIAATHVCKRLNLLNKADRIAVFQAVLYAVCVKE